MCAARLRSWCPAAWAQGQGGSRAQEHRQSRPAPALLGKACTQGWPRAGDGELALGFASFPHSARAVCASSVILPNTRCRSRSLEGGVCAAEGAAPAAPRRAVARVATASCWRSKACPVRGRWEAGPWGRPDSALRACPLADLALQPSAGAEPGRPRAGCVQSTCAS